MGLAEAGQWMGSSALARGPWSQDRPPRRMAGEESNGNATPDLAANLKRLRIVVTVRRGGAPRTKWANDGDGRSQREQGWRPSRPGLIKAQCYC
ncbi:hypothetical protein J3E69DRAFT_154657 [Trichoderma sp. SZMC 28015]